MAIRQFIISPDKITVGEGKWTPRGVKEIRLYETRIRGRRKGFGEILKEIFE